ncbi:DUF1415 domain-containing protein [Oceaniserpentilla sp. 4NH20-0058]|uniref:DUF1415 domain-containing protein n=1 Tax=Oceaniserpentilla sp. 4NH20-0058 TaxID=3127660 RepID=UPI003107027B
MSHTQITQHINQWLDDVVIGLNLCPFAAKPQRLKQIHITVFNGSDEAELDKALLSALDELQTLPAQERETTLLVTPNLLKTFEEYMLYLQQAQWLLQRAGLEGIIQIASFHPDYQFDGTEPNDNENLTNSSPYPMLHLIREDSLEQVLSKYPDPESIPENNIKLMDSLSDEEIKRLFPHKK